LTQTYKPKTAGILLIIIGIGIPALLILVLVLAFLRGEIDPFASDKSNFAIILSGSVLLLFALWILPIIGGDKAIKRKKWNFCRWTSIITLVYIPAISPTFGILAAKSYFSLAPTIVYCTVAAIPLLAIPALVLIVLSKPEFQR